MSLSISNIDLVIVLAYLVGMVLLGLWVARKQKDLKDYLLAGRDLPWWAVLGSIVATETSTVTFLSIPGIAYAPTGDMRFLQLPIGYMIGRMIVATFFLPHYFRGEIYSAYQVLHVRFGGETKKIASLLFLVTRTLADGLRLYLTAIVVQNVTNLDLYASVVVMGVVTIVYTFLGGMKTVVWSDCIQFVLYIVGALVACVVIVQQLPGGWEQLRDFGLAHAKFRVLDSQWDITQSYNVWAGVLGGIFVTLATHGTDQLMVQRYLCARSQKEASVALVSSGVVIFAQFALFLFIGIALACYYDLSPPDKPFAKNDEVFVRFIVEKLPVGVVGLTIAAVLSAAMSTLSSSLHSSATAFINDFVLGRSASVDAVESEKKLGLGRALTVMFGVFQMIVAFAGPSLGSVVEGVLKIAGFTTGIILGIFFLGWLSKKATQSSALIGLVVGIITISSVAFLTKIAWPWYPVIGSLTTFGVGQLVSVATNNNRVPKDVK